MLQPPAITLMEFRTLTMSQFEGKGSSERPSSPGSRALLVSNLRGPIR
jgi:hypothetical protein